MDFHYQYTVNAPADKLWAFVTDIPAVGMCIPGAESVQEQDGAYQGSVKVRVGPVSLTLNGKIRVEDTDAEARRINLVGEGADKRVPGNVGVRIKMQVEAKDDTTSELTVDSTANVMGKLGEFGQGLIKRKADGMMKEFGQNLSKKVEG
ncbi:MAG: SRPBCC family protein [Dehalococcoidia bacterium]